MTLKVPNLETSAQAEGTAPTLSENPLMNIGVAIQQAQRMKGFFRAFEQLEEVLRLVQMADETLKSRERDIGLCESRIEDLDGKEQALQKSINSLVDQFEAQREALEADAKRRIGELDQELTERCTSAETVLADLDDKLAKATDAHEMSMKDLESALFKKRGELASVESALENLKGRLRAVG